MKQRFACEPRLYIMLAFSLFAYLIAASVGSGWVFFISSICLAVFLLSFILPVLVMKTISLEIFGPETLQAGDSFPLRLKIKSKPGSFSCFFSCLARFLIIQLADNPESKKAELLIDLSESRIVTIESSGLKRGIYNKTPAVKIESSYPLGMVWCSGFFQAESRLVVFPRTEAFEGKFLYRLRSSEYVPGDFQSSNFGFQSAYARGLRSYQRGDSRRHIHWALSARHGRLLVKELENEGLPAYDVVLDCAENWHDPGQYELGITAAASLLKSGHNLGIHPDLFILDRPLSQGDQLNSYGEDYWHQMLMLAELEFKGGNSKTQKHESDLAGFAGRQKAVVFVKAESSGRQDAIADDGGRASVFVLKIRATGEAAQAGRALADRRPCSHQFVLSKPEDFASL